MIRARQQAGYNISLIEAPESGIAAAFNIGIQHCDEDVISILNADDWLEPHAASRGLDALQQIPAAGFTYGSIIIHGQEGSRRFSPSDNPEAVASRYMPFPHISSFVRRSVYEKHGTYDEGCKIAMDMDFYARICEAGVKGVKVDAVMGHATAGGISSRFWPRFRENFRITTRYSGLHTAIGTLFWFGPRVLAFNILRHFPALLSRMPTKHFREEEEPHV